MVHARRPRGEPWHLSGELPEPRGWGRGRGRGRSAPTCPAPQSTKAVYDRILDLRIATPQIVINYAMFLEEHKYFEESFKVRRARQEVPGSGVPTHCLGHCSGLLGYWAAYTNLFSPSSGGRKSEIRGGGSFRGLSLACRVVFLCPHTVICVCMFLGFLRVSRLQLLIRTPSY